MFVYMCSCVFRFLCIYRSTDAHTGVCVYSRTWGTCLCSCICRRAGTCVCRYWSIFLSFLPVNTLASHQTCWCHCKTTNTSSTYLIKVRPMCIPWLGAQYKRIQVAKSLDNNKLHNTWSLQPKSLWMWSKLLLWEFYYFHFIRSCFLCLWRLCVLGLLVSED